MTAPPGRPVALADVLNVVFSLGLADAAQARAWLTGGGWGRLEEWISAHRNDPDDTTAKDAP